MPVNRRSINVLGSTGTNMNETSNTVKGDSFTVTLMAGIHFK